MWLIPLGATMHSHAELIKYLLSLLTGLDIVVYDIILSVLEVLTSNLVSSLISPEMATASGVIMYSLHDLFLHLLVTNPLLLATPCITIGNALIFEFHPHYALP